MQSGTASWHLRGCGRNHFHRRQRKPSRAVDSMTGASNNATIGSAVTPGSSAAGCRYTIAEWGFVRHNRFCMLRPLLRHFELEYADGYLFWDKAGRVARDLAQAIPGLQFRNQLIDQRDFF